MNDYLSGLCYSLNNLGEDSLLIIAGHRMLKDYYHCVALAFVCLFISYLNLFLF